MSKKESVEVQNLNLHSVPQNLTFHTETKQKATPEYLKQLREENARKVKGVFRYYEAPGQTLRFNFGGQYGYNRVDKYELTDGHMAEIPLGVARHLNKNGAYPVHKQILNEQGMPTQAISQLTHRFGFQSLEFIDETEFNENKIVAANFI